MKGQEWYQADDIAAKYEEKRFSGGGQLIDGREKNAVLDAIGPVEDQRILEVACGTGRFTVLLAERGASVTGMDISAAMLQRGRQKARPLDVSHQLEFIRGDASRLPFPDDHFDTVFAMRFFHLADRPASFLSEMCRVSGRQVFFDTFNRYSSRSVYNWLLPMGSRLYSQAEVGRLLEGAGLTLARADHDFVLPYGLYRQLPGVTAAPFRHLDLAIQRLPYADRVASVSFWDCRV